MHTAFMIAGGFLLFTIVLFIGRYMGARTALSALWFIPTWLVIALINMWNGVAYADYTVAEEIPFFVVVFAIPVATAVLVSCVSSRKKNFKSICKKNSA